MLLWFAEPAWNVPFSLKRLDSAFHEQELVVFNDDGATGGFEVLKNPLATLFAVFVDGLDLIVVILFSAVRTKAK